MSTANTLRDNFRFGVTSSPEVLEKYDYKE